jgi:dolichol-phosphate mannosyltransferase
VNVHEPSAGLQVESAVAAGMPLRLENAVSAVRLSVVIPTFNEAGNVEPLVRRLSEVLDRRLPGAYELIVVDDDSPDRTWEVASQLVARFPALRVVRRCGEKGLSSAVIRGWQAARGQVLAVIDADLQHPPELIDRLWDAIDDGANLAVASRHTGAGSVGDWGLLRRGLSRGAQLLGWCVLPSVVGRVSDPMSGFFLVRRRAIAEVEMRPVGYKILLEVIGRGRVGRIAEIGYVFAERQSGESKVSWKSYLDYLAHLARLRLAHLPTRFFKYVLVGLSGVAVDMCLLYFLSGAAGLALAKLFAAEAAIANNFFWNDVWTFRDVARRQGAGPARLNRFVRYNAICSAGVVLSIVLLKLQVSVLGLNPFLANAFAIAITTLWNFGMSRTFGWAVPSRRAGAVR